MVQHLGHPMLMFVIQDMHGRYFRLFPISLSAKLPGGGFVVAAIPVVIQVNPWIELLHHPVQSLPSEINLAAVAAQSDTETGVGSSAIVFPGAQGTDTCI
ncbi:hypothetical protein OPV22_017199 [Ensete ventricosum]|uniref:Uncharacterized protein n=1 Tax=Ensete ventricosum TaxID=4639 RepID=A0AAV8QX98_ENSVE|nr:hypothetical protein OPV22_017199 [Ensete ventricosum]